MTDTEQLEKTSTPAFYAAAAAGFAATAILIFAFVLLAGIRGTEGIRPEHSQLFSRLLILGPILMLSFSGTGVLIVRKFSRHPVGWILVALGLLFSLSYWATAYTAYGLYRLRANPLPGLAFSHWLESWIWVPTTLLPPTYLILLFPDGKLPSSRWRPLLWLAGGSMLTLVLGIMFQPGTIPGSVFEGENPYGIDGLSAPLTFLRGLGAVLGVPAILGTILSIIVRLRRARAEERQQIKWIAYAVSISGLLLIFASVFSALSVEDLWRVVISISMISLSTAMFPIAIGFAILRYRLYDIEILIRRTLVYGILTFCLALIYFASVVALQWFLPAQSQFTTVLSTLAMAALFSPLRWRIQHLIDRRFYRRSYDSAQALLEFNSRARQEVDLERLSDTLIRTVDHTLQPEHVSLWLGTSAEHPLADGEGSGS